MEVARSDDAKYSIAQVLAKCKVPSLMVLMDKRVLAFFAKIVTTDNALVRASLTASFEGHSMWMRVMGALNRMLAHFPIALGHLPAATSGTLGEWAQYSILHSDRWRELVRSYGGADHGDATAVDGVVPDMEHAEDGVDVIIGPPPDEDHGQMALHPENENGPAVTFDCDLCNYKGKTNSGLQAHRRRSHQIHPPLSLRVWSPKCACCDLNFGTRSRVLDHLRQSKRCDAYIMANVEPLTPRSFAQMMERNRYLDESGTRQLLPKPGPKPKGVRPPPCSYTPVFLDESQRLASVQHLD
eukprot:825388-Amphidinium_carterae.2